MLPPAQLSHKIESFKAVARAEADSVRQAERQREGGWGLRVGVDSFHHLPPEHRVATEKNLGQTRL